MGMLKLKTKVSVGDYLEAEKSSPVRREFVEGEVYARAGTSDNHARIVGNLLVALSIHLRDSNCEPFFSEIKIRVTRNVYYYPDVLVSCEENPENPYFRNAPILIIEATRRLRPNISTAAKNFFFTSNREYAAVDQHRAGIELHRRQSDGRRITHFFDASDEEIEFQSVNLTLPIGEIYRRVRFETNANRTE